MIWVFRSAGSTSARLLAEALDGRRAKQLETLFRRVKPTDKVVMWGAYVDGLTVKTINNIPLQSKFDDANSLNGAGIRTVSVSKNRPVELPIVVSTDPLIKIWEDAQDAAEAFVNLQPTRNIVAQAGVEELRTKMTGVLNAIRVPAPTAPPIKPVGDWLPRKNNHVGGNDLRNANLPNPDFYSKKETFVNEYRVHSFLGRSIRAGRKVHRTPIDETPFNGVAHEWIRAFDTGWKISYADEAGIKQRHRDIAHASVKALGLSFGAVDIGELADGTLVVLEVNRAPGVEAGTTGAYAKAIRRWVDGEWEAM